MDSFVEFAFVAAVGGIGFEDVAVSGFEFFQDAAFVDYAGTTVVGECAEKNGVFAVLGIEGAELGEVFAEQCVSLCLGQLYASAVWFARLDLMTVANVGQCFGLWSVSNFLIIRTARSKSGSSIILRLVAKAGEVTARVTIAMRNIRILFISQWVLWFRD